LTRDPITHPDDDDRIGAVLDGMKDHLGHRPPVIGHRDPFRVLIGTVISQRTRDEQTEVATEALFRRFSTAEDMAEADLDDIESAIRTSGFYREKARRIREISRMIRDDFEGTTPNRMEELLSLPGVGRKTANCVLVYAFETDAIPVDIHVHRISNRLGWVRTESPEETEQSLMEIVPKERWLELNNLMVKFGKSVCLPRKPHCNQCPISRLCAKRISE